jgi:uncharacterized protein (TIRG00374 family)
MNKKKAAILLTFVLGFILFFVVLNLVDIGELFQHFREFSIFAFLAFMLMSFFRFLIIAYRWKVVLGAHGSKISIWSLLSYRLAGFSVSYLTPGALIGGEALRAYLLKREDLKLTKAASSVIIDKFFDLAVYLLFASVGIIIVISFFRINNYSKAIILMVTVAWLIAFSFFLYGALTKKGFFRHIFRFFRLNRIKSLSGFEKKMNETEKNISHFFVNHKREFRRCAVMSFILLLIMFVEYKIATVVFGYEATFVAVFLIICIVGISYIFPLPAGLGILEASQASIHALIGFKASQGIALSLIIRLRETIWTGIGAAATYYHGLSLAKQLAGNEKKQLK